MTKAIWLSICFLIITITLISGCIGQTKYVCPGNKETVDNVSKCPAICGDGNCEVAKGETRGSCAKDCIITCMTSSDCPNGMPICDSNYECVAGGF